MLNTCLTLVILADYVFDGSVRTDVIHNTLAEPIVLSVMEGFNGERHAYWKLAYIHDNGTSLLTFICFIDNIGTIFAYGQTSSGKTHTMMGEIENAGIIPLAIEGIFTYIDEVCVSLTVCWL